MTEQQWIDKLISKITPDELNILQNIQTNSPVLTIKLARNLGIEIILPEMTEVKKKGWIYKDPITHKYKIVLNPIYPDIMKKFTLAHEIAHFLLHKKYIDRFESLDRNYVKEFENFNMIEWEANLLASEIIMPTKIIEEQIMSKLINDDSKFSEMRLANKVTTLSEELQKMFKVSKDSSDRRARRTLRTHGYIK